MSRAPATLATGATELTITQDPGGTGTLEVVILAEWTLVAAFSVADAVAALAFAAAGARLVLALPQARLYVAQRARGAAAGLAAPAEGASYFPTASEEGWGFCRPIIQMRKLRL